MFQNCVSEMPSSPGAERLRGVAMAATKSSSVMARRSKGPSTDRPGRFFVGCFQSPVGFCQGVGPGLGGCRRVAGGYSLLVGRRVLLYWPVRLLLCCPQSSCGLWWLFGLLGV